MESSNGKKSPDGAKILELAVDTRKFEIGLFWQRSLFFWGFIAAAFVAYSAIAVYPTHDPDLLLLISSFGIVCSVAWTLANRGSKYWQGAWEAKLETYETEVLGVPLFSDAYTPREERWWGEWRYSVSRLTIALSDFTVGLWVILCVKAIPSVVWPVCIRGTILIPAATLFYVIMMLVYGRSGKKPVRKAGQAG